MTCLLAVQFRTKVMIAGDTRITNDGEYTDGTRKVFAVNKKVLAGICGDANFIDVFLQLLPSLKPSVTALDAARRVQNALPPAPSYSFGLLFVSKGQAAELSEDGLMEFPLAHLGTARAGSGGLIADVYFHGPGAGVATIQDAQNRLRDAIAVASQYRTDCGPHGMIVVSNA